ncbi:MAG TPA: ABC transporter permease [Acidobacteriota bacterium]|nr:ABC transporter permease [Acidobacteriota bacterium]
MILDGILRDCRDAVRALARNPALSLFSILTLGVATGAAIIVFSILDSILLQPLPYQEADRLVLLWEADEQWDQDWGMVSEAAFVKWRDELRTLQGLAAIRNASFSLTGLETPESPLVRMATPSYFSLLGAEAELGRTFSPHDESAGAEKVVLLSYGLWQRVFGGDPEVVGQSLELDYQPYEIIGVMPRSFRSPIEDDPPQLWLPLTFDSALLSTNRRMLAFGRLLPGLHLKDARSEVERAEEELKRIHPESVSGRSGVAESVHEIVVQDARSPLLLLFIAVGCVCLIAFCNLSNLFLAKTVSREEESSVRLALGARSSWLLRRSLLEKTLVASLGTALGFLLALFGQGPVVNLIPQGSVLPQLDRVGITFNSVLFAVGLIAAAVLFFGLILGNSVFRRLKPSISSSSPQRYMGGRRIGWIRGALVIVEVAIAVNLGIVAVLMFQTSVNRDRLSYGFDPSGLLTMRTGLRGDKYAEPGQRAAFFARALEEIRQLPGVESAAAVSRVPPDRASRLTPVGVQGLPQREESPQALVRIITPGYFEVLTTPILEGRAIEEHDSLESRPVALVNQVFADRYMAELPTLGAVIEPGGNMGARTIVGVADNLLSSDNPPQEIPTIYVPHAQVPYSTMSFLVYCRSDPKGLIAPVRRAIGNLDRLMPTYGISTIQEIIDLRNWRPRLIMVLTAAFSLLALFLAASGIYAAMAFALRERVREFGVRVALGAGMRDILKSVFKQAGWMIGWGMGIGVVLSLGSSALIESQLFGVHQNDLSSYLLVLALVSLIGLMAAGRPALQALRVDPAETLRRV